MTIHSIALELEIKARGIMGFHDRPGGTIYDANSIECGSFVDVMVMLLKVKNNFAENLEIDNFADRYHSYDGKSMNEIGLEKVTAIYGEFQALLSAL